jgi:hypothetical protein
MNFNSKTGKAVVGRSVVGRWVPEAIPAVDVSGPSHGSRAAVTINGVDVSRYLSQAELQRKTEVHESTGFLNQSKTHIAADTSASLPFSGFFDPTLQSTLEGISRTPTAWTYSPAGTATGYTTYSGTATLTLNKPRSEHADANRIDGELEVIGAVSYSTVE